MKYLVIAMGLVVPFSMSHAGGLDLRVGEEAVALALHSSDRNAGSEVEFSLMHNRDNETTVVNAGIFVTGVNELSDLEGRMGIKAYAADLDSVEGLGLALGGDISYPFGGGIAINGGAYFGPSSLAFNEVERYREWYISASFELFRNAKLAAGVGTLEVEPDNGNEVEITEGIFAQMKLTF